MELRTMRSLTLISVYLILAIPCSAETIIIDANGTGDYPTIQAAIDDSNDGDVVELQQGTY
ncbi:MAG: cell surface protein, partial [Planctomycetota bacterium]